MTFEEKLAAVLDEEMKRNYGMVKILTKSAGWCWLTVAGPTWNYPGDRYVFTVEGTAYARGFKKLVDVVIIERAQTDWIALKLNDEYSALIPAMRTRKECIA